MLSSFLILLSPTKLLDDQTHYPNLKCSEAAFLNQAKQLVSKLKKLSATELAELMDMSHKLAEETYSRFQHWGLPFTHQNAHPAILMFKGEVYRGLRANELNREQLEFAQQHIRILSGLYGILKPLDLVMPYRLMMGTSFEISNKTPNLYSFWKESVTAGLQKELNQKGVIINLASQEYFKSIDVKHLDRRIIHCDFKEKKGNAYVAVNTYSKLARGVMARYIIDNQLKKPEDICAFREENYAFNEKLSGENHFVFTR
jgi:cytoplasmic iron level regulating protein YaaA (DUF328/UPF0246 family)